jgi:hypothetical protein
LRSARSKMIWLLLSLGVAVGVLAWSAQRRPQVAPTAGSVTGEALVPVAESLAGAGMGFFGRLPVKVVSGVDTVTRAGGRTTCATVTWGGAMHPTVTVSPCAPSTGQLRLRKLP